MKNVSHAKQIRKSPNPSNVSHAKHFGHQRTGKTESIHRDLRVYTPQINLTGGPHGQT